MLRLFLVFLLTGWISGEGDDGPSPEDGYRAPEVTDEPYVEKFTSSNKEYMFVKVKETWERSRALCRSHGWKLAMPKTKEEREFIADALSETNIVQDLWVGAKKSGENYQWDDQEAMDEDSKELFKNTSLVPPPSVSVDEQCISFQRVTHNQPTFGELDCKLPRGCICERSKAKEAESEILAHNETLSTGGYIYVIVQILKTWEEANEYCLQRNMTLANVEDMDVFNKIARRMLRTRPVVEAAWLSAKWNTVGGKGGYYWLNGNDVTSDEKLWFTPPKEKGCLLIDRHLSDEPKFLAAHCERKRKFVCQRSKVIEPSSEPMPQANYYIPPYELSWNMAQKDCMSRAIDDKPENKVYLARVEDKHVLDYMIYMMANNPAEIGHLWIGAKALPDDKGEMKIFWMDTTSNRSSVKFDRSQFEKVICDEDSELDKDMACMNLDRENHNRPLMYGLRCALKQHFICFSESGKFKIRIIERRITGDSVAFFNVTKVVEVVGATEDKVTLAAENS